ncbi:MAG TPA: hypothetical protein VGI39_20240, partial [Polyangiaceae bacterium]
MGDAITRLLERRFHGAGNISGVRYQLKYSLLRAFGLYEGADAVRFEGIEDVDLLGTRLGAEFAQAKTSQTPWHWKKLADPLRSFLTALEADSGAFFTLATGFPLKSELGQLANRETLRPERRRQIEERFQALCLTLGATPERSTLLLKRLRLVHLSEADVEKRIFDKVGAHWQGGPSLELYASAALARCLDWATKRSTVSRQDMERIAFEIRSDIALEKQHQARGRGLVRPLRWEPDSRAGDYQAARDTRPGHVAAALDIRRPRWSERIQSALQRTGVCVLRGPSGEGKSTLALRFAYDRSPRNATLELIQATSPEEAAQVIDYIAARARLLDLPLLLIDDATWSKSLWPDIVRECAALGVPVLITIRKEDWQRAGSLGTNYDVLEPHLELAEAKEIFASLLKSDLVHKSALSAEWVLEQLAQPRLLLEFIYLATQG